MNAPLWPVHRRQPTDEPSATAGGPPQRHVWEGRFGAMVIEVVDGVAYVNGDRVEPMPPPSRTESPTPEGDGR